MGIRRATPADASALAELAAATFPLACPPHAKPHDIQLFIDTNLSEIAFAGYLADESRAVLITDDFAGYTLLVFQEPTDVDVAAAITTRPTVELSKLYVRPSSHGTGIAAQLIEASCELAAEWGAKAV
jgi:GNAT superfamily N-acetyltransferase